MSIRVASVNVEFNRHLDRVENFFNSVRPEVALLQEVLEADVPRLARSLGAVSAFFTPMTLYTRDGGNSPCGTCILSRFPVARREACYYFGDGKSLRVSAPDRGDTFDRALSYCDIEKGGEMFRIGTTHFTWTPDGDPDDVQWRDLDALFSVLDTAGEMVLAGDFNAPRGRAVFAKLAERFTDNIPAHYTSSIDPTFHRRAPLDVMVDGLFTTPSYMATNVELVSGVSDHCAIVGNITKTA